MTEPADRAAIRALARRSEADIVADLRTALARSPATAEAVTARGLTLIRKAKAEGERETLVAQLMNRYRLSTEEGVVLMCLAEALLRVPDNADRKSTRLHSSHYCASRMQSSACKTKNKKYIV